MANITLAMGNEDVEPYSMHVSARYLDLTKKKLELTRMPRETPLQKERIWDFGTPKSVLEPLVDYWLESYDWRAQERKLNAELHQFRTTIQHPLLPSPVPGEIDIEASSHVSEPLRIHFVHHRSQSPSAIPLLYIHSFPGSFLEIARCIGALVDPVETPTEGWRDQLVFHVVAPSVPGFAFSDCSVLETGFGARDTAAVFVRLMGRLGYERFCVWGDGMGFKVARMLAIYHPENVAAVYTSHAIDLPEPRVSGSRDTWLKYQIAKFTGARWPWCAFGYTSSDFRVADLGVEDRDEETHVGQEGYIEMKEIRKGGVSSVEEEEDSKAVVKRSMFPLAGLAQRPQTLAFGLCDSPAGLLALLLDILKPTISTPPAIPPAAPARLTRIRSTTILQHIPEELPKPLLPVTAFSPTDILNWTMMYWLPGPEASLRWLLAVEKEDAYKEYSHVPLGVSWYGEGRRGSPVWASGVQDLKWVKRREGGLGSGVPAWERSAEVVIDIREFCDVGRREGWLGL